MSVTVNPDGKLVILVDNSTTDAAEALITRRNTLYDLIVQRDENHNDDETVYYAIEMLRDIDLTYEQVTAALEKK